MRPFISSAVFFIAASLSPVLVVAQEAIDVFRGEVVSGVAPGQMMYQWLLAEARLAIAERDRAFEETKTVDQILQWQKERREFFTAQLGGFPERTPLNAKIVGRRSFADYRIEKVIFESQPGFLVTATLYLPLGEGPFPGVIHPTGHSANAKARDLYQLASIAITRGGCAVLCYDPIGQGERRQILNDDDSPRHSTTGEHTLINQGCMLLGSNVARHMIWDGMRAIDYLISRPDIRADRIGCTGISGGGTNTSYLMALDDRITAAAPGCYLTGYESLLSTIGPQDAEQNIHGQLAFGMDHADYVLMRAPRPTLIMAATGDYFDIDGAWRLFRQSKRTYTRLGRPENVDLVEPDTPHGFPTEMRVAAANWMRRWLLDETTPISERDAVVLTDKEIECTPDGQTLLLDDARSVYDLNAQWSESFQDDRKELWRDKKQGMTKVRHLIGWPMTQGKPRADVAVANETDPPKTSAAFTRHTVVIYSEPTIALPANLFVPTKHNGEYVILIHEKGKSQDATRIAEHVQKGAIVVAVDLRGIGETASSSPSGGFDKLVGRDWRETTLASLLNKSYVGMRAHDLLQTVEWLRDHFHDPQISPSLYSEGHVGIPALHAMALAPSHFTKADIRNTITSWADVAQTRLNAHQQSNLVFGALRYYDLPDLANCIPKDRLKWTTLAPDKVTIVP